MVLYFEILCVDGRLACPGVDARGHPYPPGQKDDLFNLTDRDLALGVSFLVCWIRTPLYGTLWILILAYIVQYMPTGLRSLEATFGSIGTRTLLLNARVIDRGGDRPHLILLAIEDITERKRAQEVLRETEVRKHLEDQVRERQAELAHALRISTVGELASGLAHELNQPLSAIANGVEACARYVRSGKGTSKKLLALLDDASGEAVRAGTIVEHLRHFIEKGQPQFEATDLREIARNIPRLLAREIQQGQITLRLDLPSHPLPIYADRIQIEQIIVNLMQNAIDAMREIPGDRHEIQLQAWAAKGMAEVAVRDTGTGIPAAAAGRLFEPFFTTKPHGLGMGLAISRSILEAHRGKIWAKRRADEARGTTIRFTLPLLLPPKAARKKGAT
jgi:C4-dicarboxylate-specific signal transduction histidine kinase